MTNRFHLIMLPLAFGLDATSILLWHPYLISMGIGKKQPRAYRKNNSIWEWFRF
jgi:hypothetical protein